MSKASSSTALQTRGGVQVEIRGGADLAGVRRRLTAAGSAVGFTDPQVTITRVTGFERQATVKVKRFIPLGRAGFAHPSGLWSSEAETAATVPASNAVSRRCAGGASPGRRRGRS